MKTFKEQAADDLGVFLNADEFAETHTVNGVEVQAVLEGLTTKEFVQHRGHRISFEGVDARTVILHLRAADIPQKVARGNVLELDGEMYRIADTVDDMGLLTLTLEAGEI